MYFYEKETSKILTIRRPHTPRNNKTPINQKIFLGKNAKFKTRKQDKDYQMKYFEPIRLLRREKYIVRGKKYVYPFYLLGSNEKIPW